MLTGWVKLRLSSLLLAVLAGLAGGHAVCEINTDNQDRSPDFFLLTGKVVGIRDGDTLTLLANGSEYEIRLAEIDTPERNQDWFRKALGALKIKTANQKITVEIVDMDAYGRLVGKIRIEDRNINREMVREGHAWAYRRYLNDLTLLDDEAVARTEGIGLWSQKNPIAPWEFRRNRQNFPQESSGDITAAAPRSASTEHCRIKGNISDNGRIYHMPGQKYYAATKISRWKGERWFCSEADARAAGWRKARI